MRIGLAGMVALGLVFGACGGDDDNTGDDDAPVIDAGPPDAPVATSFTAEGAFAGAKAIARQEHDDATLFEITSAQIDGSGEVDPAVLQSFWSYSFASLSTGVRINVIYLQDMYQTSQSTVNPEGLKTLGDDNWMDSDDAVGHMTDVGFVPPAGEANVQVSMKLTPGSVVQGCEEDPQWSVEKITAPPGEPVQTERWIVLNCTAAGGVVVCPPEGDCVLAP